MCWYVISTVMMGLQNIKEYKEEKEVRSAKPS